MCRLKPDTSTFLCSRLFLTEIKMIRIRRIRWFKQMARIIKMSVDFDDVRNHFKDGGNISDYNNAQLLGIIKKHFPTANVTGRTGKPVLVKVLKTEFEKMDEKEQENGKDESDGKDEHKQMIEPIQSNTSDKIDVLDDRTNPVDSIEQTDACEQPLEMDRSDDRIDRMEQTDECVHNIGDVEETDKKNQTDGVDGMNDIQQKIIDKQIEFNTLNELTNNAKREHDTLLQAIEKAKIEFDKINDLTNQAKSVYNDSVKDIERVNIQFGKVNTSTQLELEKLDKIIDERNKLQQEVSDLVDQKQKGSSHDSEPSGGLDESDDSDDSDGFDAPDVVFDEKNFKKLMSKRPLQTIDNMKIMSSDKYKNLAKEIQKKKNHIKKLRDDRLITVRLYLYRLLLAREAMLINH